MLGRRGRREDWGRDRINGDCPFEAGRPWGSLGNQPGSAINVINIPLMPVPLRNRFTSLLLAAAYGERPLSLLLSSVDDFIRYSLASNQQPHLASPPRGADRGDDLRFYLHSLSLDRAWENGSARVYKRVWFIIKRRLPLSLSLSLSSAR